MGQSLAITEIRRFLERLSERYREPVKLYLLGGSALCFLGSPRRTMDIDLSADVKSKELEATIESVALELQTEVEIVPIDEFIPLPDAVQKRHLSVEKIGEIDVFVFDPYSIALSKLARGFDADIQDVIFLLRSGHIRIEELTRVVDAAVPQARNFDIDAREMRKYFEVVKRLYFEEQS